MDQPEVHSNIKINYAKRAQVPLSPAPPIELPEPSIPEPVLIPEPPAPLVVEDIVKEVVKEVVKEEKKKEKKEEQTSWLWWIGGLALTMIVGSNMSAAPGNMYTPVSVRPAWNPY